MINSFFFFKSNFFPLISISSSSSEIDRSVTKLERQTEKQLHQCEQKGHSTKMKLNIFVVTSLKLGIKLI